jgi:3-oxoacyl-[acyl-carrier protein] reductase
MERAINSAVLKRAADKDDVAKQVVALCETDSITGQTLAIDAGRFFH